MATRKRIGPIDLSKAIDEVLKQYGDEVYDVVGDCIDEVAEEAKNRLKSVTAFRNPAKNYPESWINEKLASKPLTVSRAVHNEKHYRLTHLLEKGHVIKNGTQRTFGETAAFPHIAPVNDWANEELPKLVKRKLER